MLKCVMFDWGGVLSDQSVIFEEARLNAVFPFWKKLGFKGNLEEFKRLDEKTNDELWKIWREKKRFKRYDWSIFFAKNAGLKISKKIADQEFENFFNYYVEHSKLYPETKDILKFLRKKGLYLALISNNWKGAYKVFEKCGITKYFDVMVVSEEVNALKFHLEPFRFVLKKLKLNPEECIMVGNNIIEDGACKKLGIIFCLVDQEKKHKKDINCFDFRIENLEELKDIIQKLLS